MVDASSGPLLMTERLILRRLDERDADSLLMMAGDHAMWRHPERAPMSSEEAWSLLLRHEGSWLLRGYGAFAVQEKAGSAFVGLVGFSDFRRRLGSDFDDVPEITWSVMPSAQGQGYASEAGFAAVRWLDSLPGRTRSVALINETNAPSFAVARKLGYQPFRNIEYKGAPSVLLQRLAASPMTS